MTRLKQMFYTFCLSATATSSMRSSLFCKDFIGLAAVRCFLFGRNRRLSFANDEDNLEVKTKTIS